MHVCVDSLHSHCYIYVNFPCFYIFIFKNPFLCDSARLSRILSVYFLVAAESELSYFTDRAVARLSILCKDIKQVCEHYKNIIIIVSRASSS